MRTDGCCIVDRELKEGLRSMAAPIRDHTSTVVAAINISTHAARYTPAAICKNLIPPLITTAENIHHDLARIQTLA
ncbi:IclR family transcriptional regulator domain-containing protein [Nocardia sp. NPDC004123]